MRLRTYSFSSTTHLLSHCLPSSSLPFYSLGPFLPGVGRGRRDRNRTGAVRCRDPDTRYGRSGCYGGGSLSRVAMTSCVRGTTTGLGHGPLLSLSRDGTPRTLPPVCLSEYLFDLRYDPSVHKVVSPLESQPRPRVPSVSTRLHP